MGWRAYGEVEPKGSFLSEFFIGILWGAMSIYSFGWIFIWPGWITGNDLLVTGIVVGLLTGSYFGWYYVQLEAKEKGDALHDPIICDLHLTWRIAAQKAERIYNELDEDFVHPLFIEAVRQAREALLSFLSCHTASLRYILLKLEVACDLEDYKTDAKNLETTVLAPHAIVAAMRDIKGIIDRQYTATFALAGYEL